MNEPSRTRLDAWLQSREENILTPDGFDDALIGVAQVFNTLVAIYDREKCLTILQQRDGMSYEDAEEFFEFNVQGAYVGEQTPGFLVWRVEEREQ